MGLGKWREKSGHTDPAHLANWGDPVPCRQFLFVGDTESAARAGAHVILPPPKVEPKHEVFAEAMLEDDSAHQRRSPMDWVVSIAIHAAALSALLILPLFYTAGLDFQKFNLTFLAPPVTPPGPPPAPLKTSIAPRPVRSAPIKTYVPGKLTVPIFVAKAVVTTPGEVAPPDEELMGVPGGVPGGIPGGQMGGTLGGVLGGALKSAPAPLPAALAAGAVGPKKPVRVGGDVKQPRLLFGPDPAYPVLAKQTRVTGTVVIEAVIDEHGNVKGMHVISGDPLLIPAALDAVSKRKYEPTILDGEPTPLDLRIEISFHLP